MAAPRRDQAHAVSGGVNVDFRFCYATYLITTFFRENSFSKFLIVLKDHVKDQSHSPPEAWSHLQNFLKTIDVAVRNSCLNVWKALLNSFRQRRNVFCCENTV